MPLAHEIKAARQVLCVILTREITHISWSFSFRNLIIPGEPMVLGGMPFDHARDVGAQRSLDGGFDYVFFLDDDVCVPPDVILRLMAHRLPIVSGLYIRRSPPIFPVMIRNTPSGKQWVTSFQVPSLIEVDMVGAGCLLIHRSVLEKLPWINPPKHHWFEWRSNAHNLRDSDRTSEDFSFCLHAKQHGFKTIVDTSLQCRHLGHSESRLTPTGFEFAPLIAG